MIIRSTPPASAHFADRPVPAPPPRMGRPAATCDRKRLRHSVRDKTLMAAPRNGRGLSAAAEGTGYSIAPTTANERTRSANEGQGFPRSRFGFVRSRSLASVVVLARFLRGPGGPEN